ncbi:MAG: ACP S-malonyltransferase [Ruminiclostridium sp.]|nr:ACP S-malonyltransferase [Ruminiclostridium sp.]
MAETSKTIFLFSGQGSQYKEMGKELYDNLPECKKVLEIAESVLSLPLSDIIFNGEESELSRTVISQPAILAMSLMALEAAKTKGIEASAVAGHSLGEYAAMAASGMLSYEEAFRAIKYRSEAMEKAANANPGGMAAVLGLNAKDIEDVCKEIENGGDYITPVNYNSPAQTVIAGTVEALAKAEELLSQKGAKRIVRLAVSAAFHSRLMSSASEEFLEKAKDIRFEAPKKDFYCNVYGNKLTDFSDMPSYLAKHICSPVRFTDELNCIKADGYENYIELGPGKVLTGLVKKTLDGVNAVNIENLKTLEKAAEL